VAVVSECIDQLGRTDAPTENTQNCEVKWGSGKIELARSNMVSAWVGLVIETYGGNGPTDTIRPNGPKLDGTKSPLKAPCRKRGAREGLERNPAHSNRPAYCERKRLNAKDPGR